MIGETGMVENFDVSLFFLMKLEQSETSKISTIPVSPIKNCSHFFEKMTVKGWREEETVVKQNKEDNFTFPVTITKLHIVEMEPTLG